MNDQNVKLIEITNNLTINDLKFILSNWQNRLSIYDLDDRTTKDVESIYLNGTFLEMTVKA